jgi:murein DD-endopeptidase MepM/ murein hydrolase activator NlpD
MESYTLIWVRDSHSRPQQISVPKVRVKQAAIAAVVASVLMLAAVWDYWRLRADNSELAGLRVEATEQREQISLFKNRLAQVDSQLGRVTELERKVRIIANLPGAAGIGGEDIVELAPQNPDELAIPVGVPIDRAGLDTEVPNGQGGGTPLDSSESLSSGGEGIAEDFSALDDKALGLVSHADGRAESLEGLLGQLENKREKLMSMPSIWPAKGWLTSRFGSRVSPFTGRRQKHNGIDIAAASGTSIYSPARGRVTFAGRKGPLGNSLVIDHGFGVKTIYGHTKEFHVSTGDTVERGQEIAAVGSTGRSTGPHLHYVVEVGGKARDPLDYIFD